MLWDCGTWAPITDKSAADLDEGHLHFTLQGERMKGEWLLIRLKPRTGEKRENWLLRKIDDAFAQPGDPLVEQALTSVASGRTMEEIASGAQPQANRKKPATPRRRKTSSAAIPAFRKPQLATLVDDVPTGNGWMHEIKFDGYRAIVAVKGSTVRVYTRTGQDWTGKFGPLVEAIAALDLPPALIDGEITAHDADGNPDFSRLQQVLKRGHGSQGPQDALSFHAFDLIECEGEDLAGLPNIERKQRLEALLAQAHPPIHIADHVIGAGERLFRSLCDAGQEGVISKRIDAPYAARRRRDWLKVKCTRRQEFVIVGWKASKARGRPFASLLLAQHEGGALVYKGNVGTGFDGDTLADLAARMAKLERKTAPVPVDRAAARGTTWISPKLVAEIAFAEFTADGNVRHGSFVGLRTDKPAAQVKPEKAERTPEPVADVPITHHERVIFPESGQTKGELADYYTAIAPIILPFLGQRPISLVRCPQGRAKKYFFQKHDSGALGDAVRHLPIREKNGGYEDYLFVEDARGMRQCVQMGTIEFHAWATRADAVEAPDRMIFDLDPDEGLNFADVKSAAQDIRARLADLGLVSFAMLSGGKGVHVIVPLTAGHGWEAHKDFARRFSEALSLAEPERFTATMSKAKRRGKIFIDWLRNQRGATAVVPYSARSRSGAPVAAPIAWNELKTIEAASHFSISDAKPLVARTGSKASAGWGVAEQSLPDL